MPSDNSTINSSSSLSMARGMHCFRATITARTTRSQPRMRAKYSEEEKNKVREVRRQGACLRCKMLKIQCSTENPCLPCLSSAIKGFERRVLSYCYCVRTRFADCNIFQGVSTHLQDNELNSSKIGSLLARIAVPASFMIDIGVFNDVMVSWLTRPDFSLHNGSIMALFCSTLLSVELKSTIDNALIADFRTFLLTTSLARSHSHCTGLSYQQLCQASHGSGSSLISRLDRILTPQYLAKCNQQSCQVLFLLVLGTTLGVGYSNHLTQSPSFPRGMMDHHYQQSPTLWLTMKEHLCQMLAHHLIFLGSTLGIKMETAVEQSIIDDAICRWNKLEPYVFAEALESESEDLRTTDDNARGHTPPPLVSIPCPEIAEIADLTKFDQFSQNPESYLSMTDEVPEIWSQDRPPDPTSQPEWPDADFHWREVRRRSVWIVRPFENGDQGTINVHAIFRVRVEDGENIGMFA